MFRGVFLTRPGSSDLAPLRILRETLVVITGQMEHSSSGDAHGKG